MYGQGRGIPVFDQNLGKHGATATGFYPGWVAQDKKSRDRSLQYVGFDE